MLFPAVAAIHGIVLAALHVEGGIRETQRCPHVQKLTSLGAVDMDVYGSFQLCSIGILTASVTVRLSETYSRTPGRNTFFLWTVLILAGERLASSPSSQPDSDKILSYRTTKSDHRILKAQISPVLAH